MILKNPNKQKNINNQENNPPQTKNNVRVCLLFFFVLEKDSSKS